MVGFGEEAAELRHDPRHLGTRLEGRIVHDLRRSGVRRLTNAGNDRHVVMAFSGHRTPSMLRRYHIINVEDLRRAAQRGSVYRSEAASVIPLAGTRKS